MDTTLDTTSVTSTVKGVDDKLSIVQSDHKLDQEDEEDKFPHQIEDDDFDDFDEFQEAQVANTSAAAYDNDFAAFASNTPDCYLSAQRLSTLTSTKPLPSISTQSSTLSLEANLENIVRDTFHNCSPNLSKEIVISTDFFNGNSSLSRKLLDNLMNLEEKTSLKLNWNSSYTFQVFLKSLKIDPKCDDMNQFVPTFASGLSLLEPTKSTLVPSMQLESNTSTISIENSNQSNSASQSVIQADKISSPSLNNFSEDRPISNGIDVDCFFQSSTTIRKNQKIPPKLSSLETELLTTDTEDGQQALSIISSSSTDPIHQLISQLHGSSNISSSPTSHLKKPDITSEANQILDELPILNFMRSKILMFPVKDRSKD